MGTADDKVDDVKGRVKEAAGDLTDDDELKREGKLDRAGAKAKEKLRHAKDAGEKVVDRAKGAMKRD